MSQPTPTLEPLGDGAYLARWQAFRFRFLLSDGSTVDVETPWDSSTLRGELLEVVSRDRKTNVSIVGVASLAEPGQGALAMPTRKRRTTK